jgi:hypothetical protein
MRNNFINNKLKCYVTEPCYNENSKPLRARIISGLIYMGIVIIEEGAGIFELRISKDFLSGLVTNHSGKIAGDIFKKRLDDFSEKVIRELKKVNEIEKILFILRRRKIFYVIYEY